MNLYRDNPVIAGKTAGRRVTINPAIQPAYNRLEQAALRGHHWARIAVRELAALSTLRQMPATKTATCTLPQVKSV